jgi:hypothetical protein
MFRADLSKIKPLTEEDHQTPHPVSVTQFGQHLLYINAQHGTGIQNPTCETIRQAIDRFKPDFIILEADTTTNGAREGFTRATKAKVASDFESVNETAYTAHLAMENNIPFAGGEPTHQALFLGMEKAGYLTNDVMAFYLLRNIPYWKKAGKLDAKIFPSQAAKTLIDINRITGKPESEALTFEDFTRWFDKYNTTGKRYLDFGNDDLAPTNSAMANYFQRLHHTMDPVREHHIDTVITDALNENGRVLVVYGGGHLIKSKAVFEHMLGPGVTTQLVNQAIEPCPGYRAETDIKPNKYASIKSDVRSVTPSALAAATSISMPPGPAADHVMPKPTPRALNA